MITDVILLLIGGIIYLISGFFAAISWAIPTQVIDAIEFFFAQINDVNIFLPLDTVMQALGAYLTFITFWYSVKIIIWTYHLIRHGKETKPAKLHG